MGIILGYVRHFGGSPLYSTTVLSKKPSLVKIHTTYKQQYCIHLEKEAFSVFMICLHDRY